MFQVLGVVGVGLWLMSAVVVMICPNLKVMQNHLGVTLGTVTLYMFCFGWVFAFMVFRDKKV